MCPHCGGSLLDGWHHGARLLELPVLVCRGPELDWLILVPRAGKARVIGSIERDPHRQPGRHRAEVTWSVGL